jgi:protein ImuA
MQGARQQQLQSLRDKIAAIETGPVLAGHEAELRSEKLLAIPPGVLNEIFASHVSHAATAMGISLAMARGLITPQRKGLIVLQLADEGQKTGLPYGPGLLDFGIDPRMLVFARPQSIVELLWAMEEAIACQAVAAVVADVASFHKALDFTASRRLSLRSAASGTGVFLIRYTQGREASAARYRWRIAPAVSGPMPFDEQAAGPPRWKVILEKGRLQPSRSVGAAGEDYLVDWTKNGFVPADIHGADRRVPKGKPALPRPKPAQMGHRLSQAG